MLRVRQLLEDGSARSALIRLLPKEVSKPPAAILELPAPYPKKILASFPKEEAYIRLGILAEALICQPETTDVPAATKDASSTQTFLENIDYVRDRMRALADSPLEYQKELAGNGIVGHPDAITQKRVFEIKCSGKVVTDWQRWMLQLFAYAALNPETKRVYLVLPLQGALWKWNVKRDWPKRDAYKATLETHAQRLAPPCVETMMEQRLFQMALLGQYRIGQHVQKQSSLLRTVQRLPDTTRPYQIFLTKQVAVKATDQDLAATFAHIQDNRLQLFIHSPYLLNLCMEPDEPDNYVVACLGKHLAYGAAMGAKGVVVHVGKACKRPSSIALDNMRRNILASLESASPSCPLLLETPAGQGSETLVGVLPFMEFCASIQHPGFGVCVDTCHVFAAGESPRDYLAAILNKPEWRSLLKLIHFNDSSACQGSCKDRHAFIGTGLIDKTELFECAVIAHKANIPMVIE
jgi:deoxyribonuclease-4